MNQETDRAIIFAKWPDGADCYFPYFKGDGDEHLAGRIEYVLTFKAYNGITGFVPFAWAPEPADDAQWEALRAESIAAGRVIKLIDGKYIPFGEGAPLYCDAQGEPIAPTFYCAAETIAPALLAELVAECERGTALSAMEIFHRSQRQPEKLRPRLTWADSKPFDKFADFAVSSDTATPDHAYSHYLTRVADAGAQTPPVCGSAWLVVR